MATIRYLFNKPIFKSESLSIRGIGVREGMRPCMVRRPNGTGDYLFMFFYDEVWIQVGAELRRFPPGTIVCWQPTAGHVYGNTHKPWTHSWTHCDGPFLSKLLQDNKVAPDRPIVLPDSSRVEKYLLDLHFEINSHLQPDAVIVRNIFANWMREVARTLRGGAQKQIIPPSLLQLKAYLENHYNQPLALAELSARAHMSVPHLCARFKRYFGAPVMGYVIQLRLHQAAHLLHDQTLSVTEIARQVGYDDIYYFSKLFKIHYGLSPRQARAHYTRTVRR